MNPLASLKNNLQNRHTNDIANFDVYPKTVIITVRGDSFERRYCGDL